VSFEPTPQLPSGELSPPSVVGPTGIQVPTTIPPAGSSVPTTVPTTAPPTSIAVTAPGTIKGGSGASQTTTASGDVGMWLLVAVGTVVIVVVVLLVATRRRRLRLRSATDLQRALWAYQHAERGLRRAGMARPVWCSPPAHARALLAQAQHAQRTWERDSWSLAVGDELQTAPREFLVLAELLEGASYNATALRRDELVQAEQRSRRIRRTFRRRSVRALANQVVSAPVYPEPARRTRRGPT